MAESGELDRTWTAVNMLDIRMNLSYDSAKAAQLQHDFMKLLWDNEAFQQYFKEKSIWATGKPEAEEKDDGESW